MNFDFAYLKCLLQDAAEIRESFRYYDIDENDCEISYLPNKNKILFGLQLGTMHQFNCRRYKLQEKSSLRKGSRNYFKIYRRSGQVIRIDSYVNGQLDVIFLAYYSDSRRYMLPFSATGGFYPTYTYVTYFVNGRVTEEYAAVSDQIVYECYKLIDNDHYQYDCINYVPNGTYPVLGTESGILTLEPELQYVRN